MKIYINGVLNKSESRSQQNTFTPTKTRIGVFYWWSAPTVRVLNGKMNDLVISNDNWSDAKIKNEYSRIKGFFSN